MSDKILKAAPALVPSKIVKGDAYGASMEAAQIVDAARAQAGKILEGAAQDRQAILDAAREEAYADGLRQWNAAIAEANAARDRRLAESEPELIRLAVRIAQKILGEELRINPEAIVGVARQCLQGLGRERSLTLRVAPGDAEIARRRTDALREAAGRNRSIEVMTDAAVSPGGCIVESEYGVIDARLETQIRCLEEILLRAARK
jgi:type III secretion protein L